MILDENMEITLSLKNGENGQSIVLGEEGTAAVTTQPTIPRTTIIMMC